MILTGAEIKRQVCNGRIVIDPFNDQLINPNSYNYRLGEKLYVVSDEIIDSKYSQTLIELEALHDGGFLLEPNKLYLGCTFEIIGSDKYVTSLIGRSSVGRLGMFLQITADLGQLGNAHRWTLEIKVVQPLKVYPLMKIGQVSFWFPSGKIEAFYRDGYTQYNNAHPSDGKKYFRNEEKVK